MTEKGTLLSNMNILSYMLRGCMALRNQCCCRAQNRAKKKGFVIFSLGLCNMASHGLKYCRILAAYL